MGNIFLMDKDFHYTATFYAALTAGFKRDDARLIANSSQFIDDNTENVSYDRTINIVGGYPNDNYKFRTMITGMEGPGFVWARSDAFHKYVWPFFHFLPGNYKVPGMDSSEHTLRECRENIEQECQEQFYLHRAQCSIYNRM
jgi:hypothetical protein